MPEFLKRFTCCSLGLVDHRGKVMTSTSSCCFAGICHEPQVHSAALLLLRAACTREPYLSVRPAGRREQRNGRCSGDAVPGRSHRHLAPWQFNMPYQTCSSVSVPLWFYINLTMQFWAYVHTYIHAFIYAHVPANMCIHPC